MILIGAMIWLYPWLLLLLSVKNILLEIKYFRNGQGHAEYLSLYLFGAAVACYFIRLWM